MEQVLRRVAHSSNTAPMRGVALLRVGALTAGIGGGARSIGRSER